MKTHQIPYQEGYISWNEFGESRSGVPPLVLLHGGHGSWEHWFKNTEALSEHFHVFIPDMPGFGKSSFFDEPLQTGMIDPMLATLNTLFGSDQEINIAGFSFGGFVTAHLVNQRMGIAKIALLGSAGHAGPRRPHGELLSWRDFYLAQDWGNLQRAMRENLFQQMISKGERVDDLAIRIHQDACVATRFRSRPIARPGGLLEQLQSYAGKILMIWGEHDVTCTPEYVIQKLADGKVDCSSVIIQDTGHWVQYEKPDEVNDLLVDWFK